MSGKRFSKPAPTQEAIMITLTLSPLPWTREMLIAVFGWGAVDEAAHYRRIQRIEHGLYTCGRGEWPRIRAWRPRPLPPTPTRRMVTDDMLARYGYNL